jgi:amidophosphoribosyltransferase
LEDGIGHSCGLFGIYNVANAAEYAYLGLFALQHRGQESVGIVTSDGKKIRSHKAMGLVTEAFDGRDLTKELPGHIAVGHVRYSTTGSSRAVNIQPLVVDYSQGLLAVAHNGNLVNAKTLRDEHEAYGSIFQTSTDSEIIVHILAHPDIAGAKDGLATALRKIEGAFSLLFMTKDKLIAARDPHGFRPLVLGRLQIQPALGAIGETWVVASETCALDQIRAEFVREIEPGEIVTIDTQGVSSQFFSQSPKHAHCIFEHVYFARPDTILFGDPVHEMRLRSGAALAREHPADADIVIGVPDSGNSAAIGFAREAGLPFDKGLIRNHYIGRSFIKPRQIEREGVVRMKFNVVRSVVAGRRVVVVEDSLIRGTTFRGMTRLLRDSGAKEIHLRIACPPTRHACFYGIDFPSRDELVAGRLKMVDEICQYIGADSLGYLSVDGLLAAVSRPASEYCTACWTGAYPVRVTDEANKFKMENNR